MEFCKYCGKEWKNRYALKAHEFRCEKNPNYEENVKCYEDAMIKLQNASRNKPSAFFEYTTKCEKCGKEFTQRTTQALINRNKHKRCCSVACARSHVRDEESRQRTREALNSYNKKKGTSRQSENPDDFRNCSTKSMSSKRSKDIREHKCMYCGKDIRGKYKCDMYCYECAEERNLPNLQLWDENNKKIPSKKRIEAAKKVQERLLANGTHKGWQSRNIISYPEQFWINVLENNGIKYSFNHVVNKRKDLGLDDSSNYFLDFLISDNIDLEIDGKQHKYEDRKISDKIRDEFLTKNGFIVYRVEWNEINSDDGKRLMKEKINKFLKFYKNYEERKDNKAER